MLVKVFFLDIFFYFKNKQAVLVAIKYDLQLLMQ